MLKDIMVALSTGAVLGAIATVLVYESRGESSHAEARLELGPGRAASMQAGSIERLGVAGAAVTAPSDRPRASPALSGSELAERDDATLHRAIGDLGLKLKAIEAEKDALARQLDRAEAELARRQDDGQKPRRDRDEFDLDRDDWKKLAETGSVKYRLPCQRAADWTPSSSELDGLGLTPDDAELLRAAYQRSNRRIWATLRPLCIEAVGNEAAVDLLGPGTCTQVILNLSKTADADSARAAMREVAETRAGERPLPQEGAQEHPVFELFWALTGETPAFEADLAESLGPEDAKRIAYSKGTCSQTSSFGN